MKIILVNGPPRSGKDTVGAIIGGLLHDRRVLITKFAHAVKSFTHAVFATACGMEEPPVNHAFEATKDEPHRFFHGISPRAAYIAMSEAYMKPLLGQDIFGKMLAAKIKATVEDRPKDEQPDYIVITDCGFPQEVKVLAEEFGDENCYVLTIRRTDHDYEIDSRGDVIVPGCHHYTIHNDEDIPALRCEVAAVLKELDLS